LMKEPDKYYIETLDMRNPKWKEFDFSKFDVVFHVAGIAHVSTKKNMKDTYFKVNRDLAIETAIKAKDSGVKQFIFMSSIIVYGSDNKTQIVINKETIPSPSNFYGQSKLEAEEGILELESKSFKVLIIRPPMIYGKDSKGNYPKLSKLVKKISLFPNFDNQRSMLHIDNLCEFVKLMIDNEEFGIFFPQNKEYVNISNLVNMIAQVNGKKIRFTKFFNPLIKIFLRVSLVKKVFGSLIYEHSISKYKNGNYQIRSTKESIVQTEL